MNVVDMAQRKYLDLIFKHLIQCLTREVRSYFNVGLSNKYLWQIISAGWHKIGQYKIKHISHNHSQTQSREQNIIKHISPWLCCEGIHLIVVQTLHGADKMLTNFQMALTWSLDVLLMLELVCAHVAPPAGCLPFFWTEHVENRLHCENSFCLNSLLKDQLWIKSTVYIRQECLQVKE